jgi:hypothetical protein
MANLLFFRPQLQLVITVSTYISPKPIMATLNLMLLPDNHSVNIKFGIHTKRPILHSTKHTKLALTITSVNKISVYYSNETTGRSVQIQPITNGTFKA